MTTRLRSKVTYYRGVPLDDELLDAYPEIWEPLPDTGMQEKHSLDLRWTPGRLLFHDPATGEILGNAIEEKEARLAAEAEVAGLQAQLRELRGQSQVLND